jgi:hypothetical protein
MLNPLHRAVWDAIVFLDEQCHETIPQDLYATMRVLSKNLELSHTDHEQLAILFRLLLKHARKP